MSREVTIVTPENVTISYEVAGLGTRVSAQLVDLLLQALVLLVVGIIGALSIEGLNSALPDSKFVHFLMDFEAAVFIVFSFLVIAGYFMFYEGLRNGQTPGKRAMGIRVIKDGGSPVDMSASAIRNLIRIIELILGSYAVSVISILVSPSYKRIGDYAAGTIVVKERGDKTAAPIVEAPKYNTVPVSTGPYAVRDIHLLTKEQLEAVRRFAERRGQLTMDLQESLARKIAEPIIARLGMPQPDGQFSYSKFLDDVYTVSVSDLGIL